MNEPPVLRRFARLTEGKGAADPDDFVPFEFRGKTYQIFHRLIRGTRSSAYYIKLEVGGKVVFHSTGETRKTKAIEIAKLKIAAALDDRWGVLRESRLREPRPVAELEAILAAYETKILSSVENVDMRKETPRRNANALRVIVRRVLARPDLRGVPGSVLERPDLIGAFVRAHVADAGDDILRKDTRVRGAISTITQARSVFCKAAVAHCYAGLVMPQLAPFLTAALPPGRLPPKEGLSGADVWEIAQAALCLRASADPETRALYLVHLLFRHCGLRNDDIENARVEWLRKLPQRTEVYLRNGQKRRIAGVLSVKRRAYFKPKQSEGDVPISPCVWRELQRFVKGRAPLDFIVPADNPTDRAELIDRAHADFVRPWTAHLRKRSYELRRWGQTLVSRREGREMGSRFVRHAEKSTAARYYDTEAILPAPISLADVWAPFGRAK